MAQCSPAYSTREEVDNSHDTLFKTFASGRTKDLAWRRWQLKQLWWMIDDNESRIHEALKEDLNRPVFESHFADVYHVKKEILDFLKNLDAWTSTQKIHAGILLGFFGKARLRKDPLGVSLIIGAWNFPFVILLQPLIAAIAAGCCIMLKPSELAVESQNLLCELVDKYLDPRAIRIVTAGPTETSYLLEKRFNQIFFTGSSKVARLVAAAAAKNLTPVVLELGGRSPCIVTKTADVDLAARAIANSKFLNAGQICLSVNHVFAEPEIIDDLIERLCYWNDQFLGNKQDSMSRIVNEANFDRLAGLLDRTKGDVVYGGSRDGTQKFIHPTIVKNVTIEDWLISEEIFGPILPVICASTEDAIRMTNSLPAPLGAYIFIRNNSVAEDIMNRTLTGGVTINNVFLHSLLRGAPFGGVGESGHGAYHGRCGLDCFTHSRAVVSPPGWLGKLTSFVYPPYNTNHLRYFQVKNSLGFKRGESLDDQRRLARRRWVNYVMPIAASAVAAGLSIRWAM